MIRSTVLLAALALAAVPGCRSARHTTVPAAAIDTHLESAALVCRTGDDLATIALAQGHRGRTCEQAWEDLSRITDELLLFHCEPVCGNGTLLVDGMDYSPVFSGRPLTRASYLSFGLITDAGEQLQAHLAVPAEDAQDSYVRAVALTRDLQGIDRILDPTTVPGLAVSEQRSNTLYTPKFQ